MEKYSRYIWIVRFLCVFSLVLALLFARHTQKIEKQNELAVLEAEKTASRIAASLFVWQKDKAQELKNIVEQIKNTEAEEENLPKDTGSFKALFVTDADGVIEFVLPQGYLEGMAGFLKVTKEQADDFSTIFLPDPVNQTALAMVYEKEGLAYALYAVLRPENLAAFLEQSGQFRVTILDSSENVIISANKNLQVGSNRLTQEDNQYFSLGGGFFKSDGEAPVLAYRVNSKGVFSWIVFVEAALIPWVYGFMPVYFSLGWALILFVFSLYLMRAKKNYLEDKDSYAKERSDALKERMKNIVQKDRK